MMAITTSNSISVKAIVLLDFMGVVQCCWMSVSVVRSSVITGAAVAR